MIPVNFGAGKCRRKKFCTQFRDSGMHLQGEREVCIFNLIVLTYEKELIELSALVDRSLFEFWSFLDKSDVDFSYFGIFSLCDSIYM